jgi:hypothetical protein
VKSVEGAGKAKSDIALREVMERVGLVGREFWTEDGINTIEEDL